MAQPDAQDKCALQQKIEQETIARRAHWPDGTYAKSSRSTANGNLGLRFDLQTNSNKHVAQTPTMLSQRVEATPSSSHLLYNQAAENLQARPIIAYLSNRWALPECPVPFVLLFSRTAQKLQSTLYSQSSLLPIGLLKPLPSPASIPHTFPPSLPRSHCHPFPPHSFYPTLTSAPWLSPIKTYLAICPSTPSSSTPSSSTLFFGP